MCRDAVRPGSHAVHHHTASVGVWAEFRVRLRMIATRDDPLDEAKVQTTDHVSVVTSDHVKRTISQADAIIVVDVGQIATTAQCRDDVSVRSGSRTLAGFERDAVHRRSYRATGILLDRFDEQPGEEFVVAGRHAYRHLLRGACVELRGAPGSRSGTPSESLIADLQYAGLGQFVQMVCRQGPSDPRGRSSLLPRNRSVAFGHVLVQLAS